VSEIPRRIRPKTAQANIARLEKGGNIPSTTTLQRIAKPNGSQILAARTHRLIF
jgi:hypothetical protein